MTQTASNRRGQGAPNIAQPNLSPNQPIENSPQDTALNKRKSAIAKALKSKEKIDTAFGKWNTKKRMAPVTALVEDESRVTHWFEKFQAGNQEILVQVTNGSISPAPLGQSFIFQEFVEVTDDML